MSSNSKKGARGGGNGGECATASLAEQSSDPRIQRLIPFSFDEVELAHIMDQLPQIHADVEEAVKEMKRKRDLRETLADIAKNYIAPSKIRTNKCFWYMEAYCLLLVDALPDAAERRVSFEKFLEEFPDVEAENHIEQRKRFEYEHLILLKNNS
jgi:hypothetical protein